LSEIGEAAAVVLLRGDAAPLQCPEYPIPEAVFRAAFGRSENLGDYLNSVGRVVSDAQERTTPGLAAGGGLDL